MSGAGPVERTMEVLIFDMDGVVVDSVGHWNTVRERLIEEELGVDSVDVTKLVGMNAEDEYAYLAEDNELEQSKETYISLLGEHAKEIYLERVELLHNVRDVLDAATENGITLGVVSASYRRRVELVLDRFDLADYFNTVVAGDDVSGPSKPDPAIYEHATALLEADSGDCVAVEDSEHGVEAATGAGLYCIGYAHHPTQPLADADETCENADALVDRLHELCRTRSV